MSHEIRGCASKAIKLESNMLSFMSESNMKKTNSLMDERVKYAIKGGKVVVQAIKLRSYLIMEG